MKPSAKVALGILLTTALVAMFLLMGISSNYAKAIDTRFTVSVTHDPAVLSFNGSQMHISIQAWIHNPSDLDIHVFEFTVQVLAIDSAGARPLLVGRPSYTLSSAEGTVQAGTQSEVFEFTITKDLATRPWSDYRTLLEDPRTVFDQESIAYFWIEPFHVDPVIVSASG